MTRNNTCHLHISTLPKIKWNKEKTWGNIELREHRTEGIKSWGNIELREHRANPVVVHVFEYNAHIMRLSVCEENICVCMYISIFVYVYICSCGSVCMLCMRVETTATWKTQSLDRQINDISDFTRPQIKNSLFVFKALDNMTEWAFHSLLCRLQ